MHILASLLQSDLGLLDRFFILPSCAMMRIARACFLFSSLLFLNTTYLEATPLSIELPAESIILINAETGVVLFEKEADTIRYPASTTKIATVLYALERGGVSLDRPIPVEKDAIGSLAASTKKRNQYRDAAYLLEPDSIGLGLKAGEKIILQDLLYAILLRSANDGSNVLAQYVGGSITQYMQEVNLYLKEIGCASTHFVNPHGLHHPKHVSTARDLAKLTQVALRNPLFCQIVKTTQYTSGKIGNQESLSFLQTNKLLRKGAHFYKKAIGVKTGYHAQAQHTLVAAASDKGRTLIAVLLKNPDRGQMFLDAARLFEKAFAETLVTQTLLPAGTQRFALQLEGSRYPVQTELKQPLLFQYYPAERMEVGAEVHWDPVQLPVAKGQRVGEVRLYQLPHQLLQTAPLFAKEDVHPTLIYTLAHSLQKTPNMVWVILALLLLIFLMRCILNSRSPVNRSRHN